MSSGILGKVYVKFVVPVCNILLIYQSNDILVVSSPLYGSEVFVKLTVKGPHPTLVSALKLTFGVG